VRIVAVLVAIAACSGGGKPTAPSCADRANELGAWLAAIEPEGEAIQTSGGDHFAPGPGLPLGKRERAPVVQIKRGELRLDGGPVAIADFADRFAADRSADRFGDPARPARVILAIDADVRLDDVVGVTDVLLQAGATDLGLAFAYTGKVHTAPMASSISAQIDEIRRAPVELRATQAAQLAVHLIESCKPLDDVFSKVVADMPPEARIQMLIRGIAPALTACDCAIDLDAFRELMWHIIGPGNATPASIVDVTLTGDPTAQPVRGSTWADAAHRLIAAHGKRVRFVTR
jgi:hypothetical protein